MAEAFDVADRGAFYDKTGAIGTSAEPHAPGPGVRAGRAAGRPRHGLVAGPKSDVIGAIEPLDPEHIVRGQYEGYREVDGRRSEVDDGDVRGGPARRRYLALGRRADPDPGRQVHAGHGDRDQHPVPPPAARRVRVTPQQIRNSLRFRTGRAEVGLTLVGKKPGAGWQPQPEKLTFAEQPGGDMRPYDRLIGAALSGERWLFARQDTVEAAWRVVDPVLGDAVPVHTYAQGSWGPKEADALLPERRHLA